MRSLRAIRAQVWPGNGTTVDARTLLMGFTVCSTFVGIKNQFNCNSGESYAELAFD